MERLDRIEKILEELSIFQKDTEEKSEQTNELVKGFSSSSKQTDKQLKKLGKQIDDIGNKFNCLVEGLAYNSVAKILVKLYQVNHISARVKKYNKDNQEIAEIDIFGYCNSTINNAVLVEVKSNLKSEEVNEFVEVLSNFNVLFPEHKGKNVYGIIATPIVFSEDLKKYVKSLGIGTATISNETFKMLEKDQPSKNWKIS